MNRHTSWDWIVAYLIPGPVYRNWTRFVWQPIRYGASPWAPSACDTCPQCQENEARAER